MQLPTSSGMFAVLLVALSACARQPAAAEEVVSLTGGASDPGVELSREKKADPWTRMMTAAETAALLSDVTYRTSEGVGLPELLSLDWDAAQGRTVEVVVPLPGSPAARSGLRPHDTLETIDGKRTEGRSWHDIMRSLRVPAGRTIQVGVRNRQGELREVELKSERLTPPLLLQTENGNGGALRIALRGFGERTGQEVVALLEKTRPSAVELDVRDNPGGSVRAMLDVAGAFVAGRPILAMQKAGGTDELLTPEGPPRFTGPLTIFVNEGSASASEALAAGLRHAGRARVVGRKTFGKCLVHDVVSLRDGGALLLTLGRLHPPGQRPWCAVGIEPDEPG